MTQARGLATVREFARTLAVDHCLGDPLALVLQEDPIMPGQPPRTYDDITRSTVPEPDSSYRPTPEQQRATAAGERFVSPDERALHDAVSNALRGSGIDVAGVAVEIDGNRVTLRGRVSDVHLLPKIEAAVRGVNDVGDIVDLLVVAAGTK